MTANGMRLGLNTMRWGVNFGFWGSGADKNIEVIKLAESLGYDSIWTAEAYGTDAVVPLAWMGAHTTKIKLGTAILQIPARSPASTAMTAATLDLLSKGRLVLGLGISGPQVVEGWHNQGFHHPLEQTREYVEIVRRILMRQAPLEYHGRHYDMPYTGDDGSGMGKAMRLVVRPRRPRVPIYLAAMGPKNVRLATEVADGWLPLFFSPYRTDAFADDLGDKLHDPDFDIAPTVAVVLGDDVQACRDKLKPVVALWMGGMGSKSKNFYNDLACRFGYEKMAKEVQDLYLSGQRAAAAAAVPDDLVDEVSLCGPKERIRDRLEAWKESSIGTLICAAASRDAVVLMAELAL